MTDYTVILALPEDIANQQSCAADKVVRLHVSEADVFAAIACAIGNQMAETNGVYPAHNFNPVAVFEGHVRDIYEV